ncbi:hypothetical protein [Stappia sp. P2PMeth1]|uniref:hypothetical protein n=1 Tax=Stappia sp. P2PMeth1 TaxID=2003586 RepID=UPI001644860B|nr:hypothetical protein [Stappia sp. P2PMeth1]
MFRDEHLEKEEDGIKLELKRKKASNMLGGHKIEIELDDHTHFKDPGDGKTHFADVIVGTLPREAFDGFDRIFNIIMEIIEYDRLNH